MGQLYPVTPWWQQCRTTGHSYISRSLLGKTITEGIEENNSVLNFGRVHWVLNKCVICNVELKVFIPFQNWYYFKIF